MMFWRDYFAVGVVTGFCFLIFGMINNLRTPPEQRIVTPFDMVVNLICCIGIWPIQILIWFKLHNDDDGPWSG